MVDIVVFKIGAYKWHGILIGGLIDGFVTTTYLEALTIALDCENWSLVHILISSLYSGYSTYTLQQDTKEVDLLFNYLIIEEDYKGVVLLGHNTCCQDMVHHM